MQGGRREVRAQKKEVDGREGRTILEGRKREKGLKQYSWYGEGEGTNLYIKKLDN